MEDILASIKRIIAEDSEAVQRPPARGRKGPVPVPPPEPVPEPVAALAEPEPEPAPIEAAASAPQPEPPEPSDVLELTNPIAPEDIAMPAVQPAPSMQPERARPDDGAILSAGAEAASRTAFAALTQLQVRQDAGKENTLEGLVADLLRPMLREWLDRELPGIVERAVQAEVRRISGGA